MTESTEIRLLLLFHFLLIGRVAYIHPVDDRFLSGSDWLAGFSPSLPRSMAERESEREGENGRSNISSRRRRRFVNHNNMGEGKRSLTFGKGLPICNVHLNWLEHIHTTSQNELFSRFGKLFL